MMVLLINLNPCTAYFSIKIFKARVLIEIFRFHSHFYEKKTFQKRSVLIEISLYKSTYISYMLQFIGKISQLVP